MTIIMTDNINYNYIYIKDKINFSIILTLLIFGLIMTASSSPVIAKRIDVEKFFLQYPTLNQSKFLAKKEENVKLKRNRIMNNK